MAGTGQSHLSQGGPAGKYQTTISSFAALGVDVQITELDVGGSGSTQADTYRRVASACVSVPRGAGITVWGVRDRDSWRAGSTPLLFDGAGNRKAAYQAVLGALNNPVTRGGAGS